MIVIRALFYAALVRVGRRKTAPRPGDPRENKDSNPKERNTRNMRSIRAILAALALFTLTLSGTAPSQAAVVVPSACYANMTVIGAQWTATGYTFRGRVIASDWRLTQGVNPTYAGQKCTMRVTAAYPQAGPGAAKPVTPQCLAEVVPTADGWWTPGFVYTRTDLGDGLWAWSFAYGLGDWSTMWGLYPTVPLDHPIEPGSVCDLGVTLTAGRLVY